MGYNIISMTNATILKWASYGPCRIKSFHGFNNTGSAIYIQFHEVPPLANGTLTAGAVPACKSYLAPAGPAPNGGFDYHPDTPLSECLIALSSTETTYTALAANGGMDWEVEVDSNYIVDSSFTVVGDLTSAVNSLAVWSEAAAAAQAFRLLRLDVVDTANAGTDFLNIFCMDSPPPLSTCFTGLPIPLNTTTKYFFGHGLTPSTPVIGSLTPKIGCTVHRGPYLSAANSAQTMACRAIYANVV